MSITITDTVTAPSPTPSLRVIKNGFGAEICGLEFANGVSDEGYRFIEDAVKKVGCESSNKCCSAKLSVAWICCRTKDKTGRRDPS